MCLCHQGNSRGRCRGQGRPWAGRASAGVAGLQLGPLCWGDSRSGIALQEQPERCPPSPRGLSLNVHPCLASSSLYPAYPVLLGFCPGSSALRQHSHMKLWVRVRFWATWPESLVLPQPELR